MVLRLFLLFCPRLLRCFRCRRGFGAALLEAFDAARGIDQGLFAGIEGMALGANFDMNRLFGRAGCKGVATATGDLGGGEVLGVELIFHGSSEIIPCEAPRRQYCR